MEEWKRAARLSFTEAKSETVNQVERCQWQVRGLHNTPGMGGVGGWGAGGALQEGKVRHQRKSRGNLLEAVELEEVMDYMWITYSCDVFWKLSIHHMQTRPISLLHNELSQLVTVQRPLLGQEEAVDFHQWWRWSAFN